MSVIFYNTKTDRQFNAATGLNRKEFDGLAEEYKKTEVIFYHGGLLPFRSPNSLKNARVRLFFTLYYLKVYPTFDILGICFGLDAAFAEQALKDGVVILEKTLHRLKLLPARAFTDEKSMQKALAAFGELFIDATERRVQRPENQADQEEAYSGKKKPTP